MNRPVPEADPVAYARMKYDLENREKASMLSHALGMFKHSPDTRAAAKSGTPSMAAVRPTLPLSVPAAYTTSTAGGVTDVNAQVVTDSTALDTKPDARQNPPAATGGPAGSAGAAPASGATGGSAAPGTAPAANGSAARTDSSAAAAQLPPPTNHTPPKSKKKPKKKEAAPQTAAPQTPAPQATPAAAGTAATGAAPTDPQPPSK